MKFTKNSIVLFICCFLLLGVVRKAEALSFAEYAYQRARVGQVAQITGYMQRGYPIDAISSNGYTALCYATEAGDYGAYRLLRRLGANAAHRCMQAVNADNATNFAQRYQPEASAVAKKAAEEKVNPMWQYAAVGGIVAGGAAAVAWWANEDDNDNNNVMTCPTGQEFVDGVCVPIECPEGSQLIGNECVMEGDCPTGQRPVGGECVPIECPEGTVLQGNACVSAGISIDNENDNDVFGIKSPDEDVFNLYSTPKYPDDEATITIKNKGNGDVTGIYGLGNVFNSFMIKTDDAEKVNPLDSGVGNIIINNTGSGNVYGVFSRIEDVMHLKEAYNAYSYNNGKAYGNIDITHTGGGSSFGIFGDVRAYNARAEYGGSAYGDITIHGDGNIYGLSGYAATTNAVSPFFGHEVIGHINLFSEGDGDVYGMMVSKDDIEGVGQPDTGETLASWFAFNAYASGGGDYVEGLINIHNTGNGNVYGMYGGEQLFNAMSYGGKDEEGNPDGTAKGTINIVNLGDGDVYGMYSPEGYEGLAEEQQPIISNNSDNGAESIINLVNAGDGVTTGMRGGQGSYIENTGEININALGNGAVYGIYGDDNAFLTNEGQINIYSEKYIDEVTQQEISPVENKTASVYGMYAGAGANIAGVVANNNEDRSGEINIDYLGNGDVFGIYSGGDIYNTQSVSVWEWEPERDEAGNIKRNENGEIIYKLDEEGNRIPVHFVPGKSSQYTHIVNKGDGDVYALLANGNIYSALLESGYDDLYGYAPKGSAESRIDVYNFGNGNVFGLYSRGNGSEVVNKGDDGATSVINLVNTGDGVTTGMRGGQGSYIENTGEININNLGDGTAVGIYGGAGADILNAGTINIYRGAFTDETDGTVYQPDGATGGTAYGIYAESGATVKNTGSITVTGAENGTGIYLEKGATLENSGDVIFNGMTDSITENGAAVDIYGDGTQRADVNLADMGGEVVLSNGGRFFANTLSGNMGVSADTVKGSFSDEYVLSGSLQAENVNELNLASKSAMFEAGSRENENGGFDVVLERKDFNDIIDDKDVSGFLEENYKAENGGAIYDNLKSAGTLGELQQKAANTLGTDVLPNFRREDTQVYRSLSRQFNDNLFNRPDENYFGGYKYTDISTDADGVYVGGDGEAHTAYGMLKNKASNGLVYGAGFSATRLENDYDNGSSRKSNIFGLWLPLGYDFNNGLRWYSKLYAGYADGSYDRVTDLGKYSSDYTQYQYGIGNEVRYSVNLGGGFKFEPLAELNLLGIYQDGFDEGTAEGAIHSDSLNSLSLESGLGAYLTKEIEFSEDSRLGLQIGGVYYVEFLDTGDKAEATLAGMESSYKIKNVSTGSRAALSARVRYDYKDLSLYGNIEKETGGNDALLIDAGVQYKF